MANNLSPWIRLAEPEKMTLSDYYALAQRVSVSTRTAQIETGALDDPLVEEVVNSLRFELENSEQLIKYLKEKLKAKGDSDDD